MRNFTIIPNSDESQYKVFENSELKYIVQRKTEYPNHWYAVNADKWQVLKPEQFRYDLFAQLKNLP